MKGFTVFAALIMLTSYAIGQSGWITQNSGTNAFLAHVFFIDQNNGWVTGWGGTILHTADGGNTWSDQNAPPSNTYDAIYFVDDQTGWAAGYAGRIISTTDGGSTWTLQSSNTQYSIADLYFVNADTGWTVGGKGRTFTDPIREIRYTADGGNTWTTQVHESGKEPLSRIFFIDKNIGYAVGEFSAILRTNDGGVSWTEQMYGTGYHFNDVYFVNPDTGWVVGTDLSLDHFAVIFSTTDGGSTWNLRTFGADESLEAVHFVNDSTGFAVGGANTIARILKTTDGGSTWNSQNAGTTNYLSDVFFADESNGWAVGFDGTIIHTGSGGVVGISDRISPMPKTVRLAQNYPNPFNPETEIGFQLPRSTHVLLKVYNVLGEQVRTLVDNTLPSGRHSVSWDGKNDLGQAVTSGIYLYQLKAEKITRTRRMVLVK